MFNNDYTTNALPQAGDIIVNKAIFAKTGTYNDMTMRPFQTEFNSSRVVDAFKEATHDGTNINNNTIGGLAGQFIKPSSSVTGNIAIPNGWGAPRFRFMLDITKRDTFGRNNIRKIIQGYTDFAGAEVFGNNQIHVSPDMRLFFNNVISLRTHEVNTPGGVHTNVGMVEANHLLTGSFNPGFDNTQQDITYTMTPENTFRNMNKISMLGSEGGFDNNIIDTRSTFSQLPVAKSRRANGSPTSYLNDIFQGYKGASDSHQIGVGPLDDVEVYEQASGAVKENLVTSDDFLRLLLEETTGFGSYGSVTYGEIIKTIPDLDNVAAFVLDTNANVRVGAPVAHIAGQTEHWHGSGMETIWASALSNSVPSLMMDSLLTKVVILSTNRITGAQMNRFDTRVLWATSFVENLDTSPYLQQFINRFNLEIMEGLTQSNVVDYELELHVDIAGETRIKLNIGPNAPTIEYTTPSFSDGLFSPVLNNDSNAFDKLSFDLSSLATEVTGNDNMHSAVNNASWNI